MVRDDVEPPGSEPTEKVCLHPKPEEPLDDHRDRLVHPGRLARRHDP